MNEVFVRLVKMPVHIKGNTVVDENDDYNIYINKDLLEEEQREVYRHEIRHIRRGHFQCEDANLDDIECDADIKVIDRGTKYVPGQNRLTESAFLEMGRIADEEGAEQETKVIVKRAEAEKQKIKAMGKRHRSTCA